MSSQSLLFHNTLPVLQTEIPLYVFQRAHTNWHQYLKETRSLLTHCPFSSRQWSLEVWNRIFLHANSKFSVFLIAPYRCSCSSSVSCPVGVMDITFPSLDSQRTSCVSKLSSFSDHRSIDFWVWGTNEPVIRYGNPRRTNWDSYRTWLRALARAQGASGPKLGGLRQ